jgi:linoleoyl-CoA desaturase
VSKQVARRPIDRVTPTASPRPRRLESAGRTLLLVSLVPPAWAGGTATLAAAKIVENMEIGHNVLHGQWGLDGRSGDPLQCLGMGFGVHRGGVDALPQLCPSYLHRRARQVRDLGYAAMRVDPCQPWKPIYCYSRSPTSRSR